MQGTPNGARTSGIRTVLCIRVLIGAVVRSGGKARRFLGAAPGVQAYRPEGVIRAVGIVMISIVFRQVLVQPVQLNVASSVSICDSSCAAMSWLWKSNAADVLVRQCCADRFHRRSLAFWLRRRMESPPLSRSAFRMCDRRQFPF